MSYFQVITTSNDANRGFIDFWRVGGESEKVGGGNSTLPQFGGKGDLGGIKKSENQKTHQKTILNTYLLHQITISRLM